MTKFEVGFMKSFLLTGICVLIVGGGLAMNAHAQNEPDVVEGGDRRAQTGMKFLSISLDPRAAAMADAVTATQRNAGATALFYNPSGVVRFEGRLSGVAGQVQWIGDVDYNYGGVVFRPANGAYGNFGFSFVAAEYGEFEEVIRADNDRGYLKLGTYEPTAYAFGINYGRTITDRFSVGGNIKYASQSLGQSTSRLDDAGNPERISNDVSTVAFDFGTLYHTGFRSLDFGVSVRNFSPEISYQEESFELPLTLRIGLSMDLLDLTKADNDVHSFLFSVDAQRPRDYAEQISVGGEYTFMDILSLRAGYGMPTDEESISLGVGVHTGFGPARLGFDYTYTEFGQFGSVNRFGLVGTF